MDAGGRSDERDDQVEGELFGVAALAGRFARARPASTCSRYDVSAHADDALLA